MGRQTPKPMGGKHVTRRSPLGPPSQQQPRGWFFLSTRNSCLLHLSDRPRWRLSALNSGSHCHQRVRTRPCALRSRDSTWHHGDTMAFEIHLQWLQVVIFAPCHRHRRVSYVGRQQVLNYLNRFLEYLNSTGACMRSPHACMRSPRG